MPTRAGRRYARARAVLSVLLSLLLASTLLGILPPPGAEASSLVATATVGSPTPDSSSLNNSPRTTTGLTVAADLRVTKSADSATLVPGTDATYTVVLRNLGPSTARQISFADALPDGISLRAAGASADTGSCTVSGRVVACEVAELAPTAEVALTLPVSVTASFADPSITNTASATAATPDPVAGNDSGGTTNPVNGLADLTLRKSGPTEVRAGTPLGWQLELANDGPSNARETIVTDTLPPGVGPVDVSSTQGTCAQSGRTVRCTVGEARVRRHGADRHRDGRQPGPGIPGGTDRELRPGDLADHRPGQ